MAENEFEAPEAHPLTESIVEHIPFNPIAENSLLIALFEDENAWDEYGILIKPEWFMDRSHRTIFEEMEKAAAKGERITPLSIATRIRDQSSDSSDAAIEVVIGMHDAVRVGDTRAFLHRVQNDFVRRKLLSVLKNSVSAVYESSSDEIDDLIERIHKRVDETSSDRLTDDDITESSAPALLAPVQEELDYIREHGRPREFLSTGFLQLNELTWGGFRPGQLNILAGRPGMGKTSFALNLCENVFKHYDGDATILFFTLEQRTEEIMFKMLSAMSEVPFGKLKTGRLSEEEQTHVDAAKEGIEKDLSDFVVINPNGLTISQMIHTVKQVKRARGRLDLVCVDYVGLMDGDANSSKYHNRPLEIAEITRGLKNLANQEAVPILALAQLNRNADARTDQRPRLSDLRDSGSIEQDADLVMMLHRAEPDDESKPENDPKAEKVTLFVTKNRHGPIDKIDLRFYKEIAVFDEIDTPDRRDPPPY